MQHRHSPDIGDVVMATPTRVLGQGTGAWRVINIFFPFPLLILEIKMSKVTLYY